MRAVLDYSLTILFDYSLTGASASSISCLAMSDKETKAAGEGVDPQALKALEKASLSTLILSLSSSALIQMGLEPSMKDKKNLKMAQFNIDMLEVLKDKTQGQRDESETKLLEHCISDLKMHYVKASG